jgi:hypothetical protein
MAFCTKCGAKLADGIGFCTKCGNQLFGSVTNDVRAGNHEKLDNSSSSMEEIAKNYKAGMPPQQTVPPSLATQNVPQARDNLLIALIVLSAVTIVVTGFKASGYSPNANLFAALSNWLSIFVMAVALVEGYTYRSSILKIGAFIALALEGQYFVYYLLLQSHIFTDSLTLGRIMYRTVDLKYIIFSVIFLVCAIKLLKKNTESGK